MKRFGATIFHHVKHLTTCLLGHFFTLEQDGQKSEGAIPPIWKVEGPLAPCHPPPIPPPMVPPYTDIYNCIGQETILITLSYNTFPPHQKCMPSHHALFQSSNQSIIGVIANITTTVSSKCLKIMGERKHQHESVCKTESFDSFFVRQMTH